MWNKTFQIVNVRYVKKININSHSSGTCPVHVLEQRIGFKKTNWHDCDKHIGENQKKNSENFLKKNFRKFFEKKISENFKKKKFQKI